jgi:peptidylprolyl isomerase
MGPDNSIAISNFKALLLRFTDAASATAQAKFLDQSCQDTRTGIGSKNTFPIGSVQVTGAVANQGGECRVTSIILGGCPPAVNASAQPAKPVESAQAAKPAEVAQPAKPAEVPQPAKPAEVPQQGKPVEGAQQGKTTELADGLKYTDTKVGDGTVAEKGYIVSVQYTGWIYKNGNKGAKFDSSLDRGKPITFTLGKHEVIAGWEEGLTGMKVGGKRTLIIPPSLGYGATGSGSVIPPNATLIFEVELVSAR